MNNWNEIVGLKGSLLLVILHMKILILERGKNKNVSTEITVTHVSEKRLWEREEGRDIKERKKEINKD